MILAPLLLVVAVDLPELSLVPHASPGSRPWRRIWRRRILALSYDLGFDDRFDREEVARQPPTPSLPPTTRAAARAALSLEDLTGGTAGSGRPGAKPWPTCECCSRARA